MRAVSNSLQSISGKSSRLWVFPNLLLALIALLLLASLLGNSIRPLLRSQHPPRGQLVDIGGYRLHLHCLGEGEPVVVFEAAVFSPGLTWDLIQPGVAKTTTACVYDRAGVGWSEPGPKPRTVAIMAEELHALLTQAGIPGPYVLVGYSSGGWQARYFAHVYPQELAGMVMVDSAHEDQLNKLGAGGPPPSAMVFPLIPAAVRSGIPALFYQFFPVPGSKYLDRDSVRTFQALLTSEEKYAEAIAAEMGLVWENMAAVRTAGIRSFGDIPLVVLAHDGLEVIPGIELSPEANQLWLQLQSELAGLSSRGKLVITRESGHDILFEQPDLVIGAIEEVVNEIRNQRADR